MNSRIRQFGMVVFLGSFLLVAVTGVAFGEQKPAVAAEKDQPAVVQASVEGKNFCLGCALKKEKGAKAQCSLYGHKHALKVSKAVSEDGKELTEMKGWVLHYLETEKSEHLIKEHHGEKLTIKGKIYPLERVIEVDSFKETKAEVKKAAAAEQKTCPVMEGTINKKLYTEYKGKKVYFCCAGCKTKFEKNPEKYLDKLPQFKD